MARDADDWPEEPQLEPEPELADDERVLRGRSGARRGGGGTVDYVEAVTARDDAWWATLSDYEHAYGILRALEGACERGVPLHLARCVHHLHDLLGGLDPADRAWVGALLRRIRDMLARRTGSDATEVTLESLLVYLSEVRADARFAPPSVLPPRLVHRLYPRGMSLEELQEALDGRRYPRGKPLPACPVCEPDLADLGDSLAQAVAALPTEQQVVLVRLGHALALDGDAPDLPEQLAWVTGAKPMPARYQVVLERAAGGGDDTIEYALKAVAQP